jgi:hypothetical protein
MNKLQNMFYIFCILGIYHNSYAAERVVQLIKKNNIQEMTRTLDADKGIIKKIFILPGRPTFYSLLSVAAALGMPEMCELLVSKGMAWDEKTGTCQETSLHVAAQYNNTGTAQWFLNRGIDVDVQDNWSKATPLHDAASNCALEVMKLLIANEAVVNMRTTFGDTPLHHAVKWQSGSVMKNEIVKLLLDKGALADIKNTCNKKPLDYISEKSDTDKEIRELLFSAEGRSKVYLYI